MESPQQHPVSWMRRSITPPAFTASSGPVVAVVSSSSVTPEPARASRERPKDNEDVILVVVLMENRHMNVWSRHSGSQNVPHIFSCSCLKVVWFRGVIMVFLILWLNDVPIEKCKIVKHSAAAELAQLC